MASTQHILTQIGERMRRPTIHTDHRMTAGEMPAIADLVRRIDHALAGRRAA